MLAEFDKTRQFADQKGTAGFTGPKPVSNGTRLPGPHFILENLPAGTMKDEERAQAGNPAMADRWFNAAKTVQSDRLEGIPSIPVADATQDGDFAPPGLPVFLAQARGAAAATAAAVVPPNEPEPSVYATDPDWMRMPLKPPPWTMADLTGMIGNNQMMPSDAVQMIPLNPLTDPTSAGFSNSATHQHAPVQYMPAHPELFMTGYPQHFASEPMGAAGYMSGDEYG